MNKRFSIRRYLTGHILFWVILMTALPIAWVYWDAQHEVDELFDASLAQSARVLHGLVNRAGVENSRHHLHESLQTKDLGLDHFTYEEYNEDGHEYEKKVAFQLWNPDGTLVLKSGSAPEKPLADLQKGYAQREVEDYDWRTFTLFSEADQWWLIVGERDDIREEILEEIIHSHVWPLLLITPLLALIVWRLIGKSLKPLLSLSKQLDQRDYRDLDVLDDRQSPQETLSLVSAMNSLFQRLNSAYQRESRFAGDAAHELRNPLAALMIHAENALEDKQYYLEQAGAGTDIALQQHLTQQQSDLGMIRQGIRRLSHIVQQLLALSRAENRVQEEAMSRLDLTEVCQEVVQLYQAQAQQKSQVLELHADRDCYLKGNRPLLSSLVSNLVNNAINYTPDGEIRASAPLSPRDVLTTRTLSGAEGQKNDPVIRVSCLPDNQTQKINLIVEDSGPGIPAAERERVRDRFYRVKGNDHYGVGLGLSIVQAIAEQHEAEWELGESELGGLKVTVTFAAIG